MLNIREDTFMRRLLSKSTNRKFSLMELLEFNNYDLNLQKALDLLQVSEQTLRKDIEEISEKYSQVSLSIVDQTIHCVVDFSFDLNYFFEEIMDGVLAFQLIEALFFNENTSIHHMADLLHASESTVYRNIKQLNNILKEKFNIKLSTTPLATVGDEHDIRRFYNQYFSERYNDFRWIFQEKNKEKEKALDQFLLSVLKGANYSKDYGFYTDFKTVVTTNLYRFSQGFQLTAKEDQTYERINLIYQILPEKVVRNFEKAFNVQTRPEDLYQIFGDFIHPSVLYSTEEVAQQLKQGKENSEWKYAGSVYALNELIDQLCDIHQIQIDNKEETILNTHNSLFLYQTENDTSFILVNRKQRLISFFANQFPDFMNHAIPRLKTYAEEFSRLSINRAAYLYHVVYNFVVNWVDLEEQLERKNDPIKILVISNLDFNHALVIKSMLNLHYLHTIQVEVFKDSHIDWQELDKQGYDLIITTFPKNKLDSTPLFSVSEFPNQSTFHRLQRLISYIRQKKMPDFDSSLMKN